MKRQLILEDGSVYIGEGFGSDNYRLGELVFNTSMSGYQEMLSDLSYCAQIITTTYPLMGNYGINRDDYEALQSVVFGFVVNEDCKSPSNWRYTKTLDEYLKSQDIPGLSGVDTRAITKKIREVGTMKAIMADMDANIEEVVEMLKQAPYPSKQVAQVSTQETFQIPNRGKRVVLVDFGVKRGIIRELNKRGCDISVVPYNTTAEEILALQPDGVMLSNGPGDPKEVVEAIEMIKGIVGKLPIFGICLGHQLLGLACGANTSKLRFGHRGANHPVQDLRTKKVAITSQNHSFAIDENSLEGTGLEVTHIALNDKSVEGMRHTKYPAFSVQYHPEASPGPEDASPLFDDFMDLMKQVKENTSCQKEQI